MRRRAMSGFALLAAVATLLAGCAAIPSSGSVNAGNQPVVNEPPELDTIISGPDPGYTQEQILRGFLDAAASPRNNYGVAQQYLTPEFADEWAAGLPAATIDALGDRGLEPVDDTMWQVDATPVASLTASGQYDVQDSSAPIAFSYRFEQVEGEWRISEAPLGLLIDETTFRQVFRQHSLYFFDPEYDYLVPDLRWFADRDSVQTSIVNALLAGPVEWLRPGVVSAFPEGVQLDPASVPVAGSEASVNLSGAAFDDLVTVQRMHLQLEASLVGSVRSIERVALSLGGARQDVPDLASEPEKDPRVDPRPAVFDGEVFGHLATSGEGIEPIPGLSQQIVELGPTGVSLGPGGESAAVRSAAGVSLARVDEETTLLDLRANLVVPAIDAIEGVWSVPADSPGQLVWYSPAGEAKPMGTPWSGTSIAALEVSRDGTRIVAILGDGARTHFMAASIERDADGVPVALGPVALRLADVAGTPRDVAWLDSSTVASLTEMPGGGTRVITQDLGGTSDVSQGPEGGVAIDGGNGDVRVLTSTGDLYARSGVGWQPRASGIRLVAAQQPR